MNQTNNNNNNQIKKFNTIHRHLSILNKNIDIIVKKKDCKNFLNFIKNNQIKDLINKPNMALMIGLTKKTIGNKNGHFIVQP